MGWCVTAKTVFLFVFVILKFYIIWSIRTVSCALDRDEEAVDNGDVCCGVMRHIFDCYLRRHKERYKCFVISIMLSGSIFIVLM